ncbi:MAG: glycosyltransferase, partial [Steroidobacteraceae bacterium]
RLAPAPAEIIVVDGAGSAATASVCSRFGARWIASAPGRGVQLASGVRAASSEILWFVHADCLPATDAVGSIREVIAAGAHGGYFRFRFGGRRGVVQRVLECCIAWRCRIGMVYGDQGIFVRRTAYAASPGFRAEPLFEEVALVRALKASRRFVGLHSPMAVSPRRWQRDGFMQRTAMNRMLATSHALGVRASTLAQWYTRTSSRREQHTAQRGQTSERG